LTDGMYDFGSAARRPPGGTALPLSGIVRQYGAAGPDVPQFSFCVRCVCRGSVYIRVHSCSSAVRHADWNAVRPNGIVRQSRVQRRGLGIAALSASALRRGSRVAARGRTKRRGPRGRVSPALTAECVWENALERECPATPVALAENVPAVTFSDRGAVVGIRERYGQSSQERESD